MAKIIFNPNLFLGVKELNKLQSFMQDEGYKKHIIETTGQFGLIKNNLSVEGSSWDNGQLTQGSTAGTINIGPISAIDSDGNFLYSEARSNVVVLQDSLWRWLVVSHTTTKDEEGTVSIGADGTLTGVGTKFTEVLRGQPNIASTIKITSSGTPNDSIYTVLEVISDTEAILQGSFTPDSDLRWAVAGSFTPSISPPAASDFPFEYDAVRFDFFIQFPQSDPPTLPPLTEGNQFLIGRVRGQGQTVEIEDWRKNYIYKTKDEVLLNSVDFRENPLIGVESVKYKSNNSSLMDNIVKVGWGFRSTNYTLDGNSSTLTINAGEGGIVKTTADFVSGNFNGWRVYTESNDGYSTVVTSSRTTTQINLLLDTANGSDFNGSEISIVPPYNQIELVAKPLATNGTTVLPESSSIRSFSFNIKDGFALIELPLYRDSNPVYQLEYGYVTGASEVDLKAFPSDTTGFYDENSFDENGVLKTNPSDRLRVPYIAGRIPLKLNNNSYSNFKSRVDPGDTFGTEMLSLNNASPIVFFETGNSLQYQFLDAGITLTINHFISLQTSGVSNGNKFLFRINKGSGLLNRDGFTLKFVQDYVDLVNTGSDLLEIDDTYTAYINDDNTGNLMLEFIFDGTNWVVQSYVSAYTAPRRDGLLSLTGIQNYSTNFNLTSSPATALTHKGYVDSGLNDKLDSSKIDLKSGSSNIRFSTYDIGSWNMNSTSAVGIAHGLGSDWLNVVSITVMIYNDVGVGPGRIGFSLTGAESSTNGDSKGSIGITDTLISLQRTNGSTFDSPFYTSTTQNRGTITVTYTSS